MNFFSLILPCISYHFIRFDSIYIVNMMMIWLIELRLYSIRWFVIVLILAMEKKWNDFFLLFLHNQKNGINEHWFGVVQEKKRRSSFIIIHQSKREWMNECYDQWNGTITFLKNVRLSIDHHYGHPAVCVCANIARWSSEKLYIDIDKLIISTEAWNVK